MCGRACVRVHVYTLSTGVRLFGVLLFVVQTFVSTGVRLFGVLLFVVQTFVNSGLQNVYKSDANSRVKVCQMGVYSSVRPRKLLEVKK